MKSLTEKELSEEYASPETYIPGTAELIINIKRNYEQFYWGREIPLQIGVADYLQLVGG